MSDRQQEQKLLRAMRADFIADVSERCDQIEKLVLALEVHPDDRRIFNELNRHIHSLKGSGGTHGIAIMSHICHQLENVLAEFNNAGLSGKTIPRALAHVDLLRRVSGRAGNDQDDFADIYAELTGY